MPLLRAETWRSAKVGSASRMRQGEQRIPRRASRQRDCRGYTLHGVHEEALEAGVERNEGRRIAIEMRVPGFVGSVADKGVGVSAMISS